MKLRFPSRPQQLLFLASSTLLLLASGAQAQQASLKMKASPDKPVSGVITGVSPSGVAIQIEGGQTVTYPLSMISNVQMAPPAEYNQALQAMQNKETAGKASEMLAAVVARYKGLPTDWAQQASAMIGDLALQANNTVRAEMAYTEFRKLYPGVSSLQYDVGMANIAALKKNFNEAREKVGPAIEAALKDKNVSLVNRFAYSRAFYVSGLIKESEDKKSEALEDYLLTFTVFYHDPSAVASAKERIDALRKEKVTVP